ncbi:hypothetical protein ABDK96_01565 [Citricoccus nitrophenolicus]|uniref:Uncharacterized protein n=1 Tax=Citricoccus nitrophenolicus TaxID=863575 RepID=A0ABV0IEF2_9MICC
MHITPRLRRALGMGLATGAASAIPLWRIPRAPLVLSTGGLAAVAAAGGSALAMDRMRREEEVQGTAGPAKPLARRIAAPALIGTVAGGVAAGAMWFTAVSDRWAEAFVARLGARHPRATYAVAAGVLTGALEYADSSQQKPSAPPSTPAGEKA